VDAGTGLRSVEDGDDDGGGRDGGWDDRGMVRGWLAGHGRWEGPRASGGHVLGLAHKHGIVSLQI